MTDNNHFPFCWRIHPQCYSALMTKMQDAGWQAFVMVDANNAVVDFLIKALGSDPDGWEYIDENGRVELSHEEAELYWQEGKMPPNDEVKK